MDFRFDENLFYYIREDNILPYRPQTIKFVYARLLLQSRYGSTAPSRREPIEISATCRIEAASTKSISLPFKGGGNPSEPKFAMRLTEGVIFLMNNEYIFYSFRVFCLTRQQT